MFYFTVYSFPRFPNQADFFNDIKFGFSLYVCSSGGLILDYAVDKYHGIAVFSPVMNGRFLVHDVRTLLRPVCASWPHVNYFPIWPFHSVDKFILIYNFLDRCDYFSIGLTTQS